MSQTSDVRLTERAALAVALDRDLQCACRAEAQARLRVGVVAHELLRRRAYGRLGFARLRDYACERLGISARTLESAACVAARLDELPVIASAFARGELSWTQVRVLTEVAAPSDDEQWLARARTETLDGLMTMIEAARGSGGIPAHPDDDLLDGEPATRLRLSCPGRVRALWHLTLERASRAAGESLPTWRAVELIAAEGIAGRPSGMSVGDRLLRAWLRLTRRFSRRGAGDVTIGAESGHCASASARAAGAGHAADGGSIDVLGNHDTGEALPSALAVGVSDLDAFGLDAGLREAMQAIRTAEPRIGQRLRLLIDHRLYRALGFRSVDAYVRERLGLSPRKAWALLKVEKTARRTPAFAAAYSGGTLSWARALTLLPVLDRETAGAWIERARTVTVRRLADEVNWVLEARDVYGPAVPLGPPPVDAALSSSVGASRAAVTENDGVSLTDEPRADECQVAASVQIGAQPGSSATWTQSVTPPRGSLEVSDAEIAFTGPTTVVALFRDALDVFARADEPRWVALERLLHSVLAEWEAWPRHRDPVFARDGWRCRVPACSARRELQDHHITFRSRGGSNARSNRIAICAAHHHHGIHAGVIRASGTAPHAVRWELGVRREAPALLTFIGDRLCDPTATSCSKLRRAIAIG
jgi:hypothetical protein